MNALASLRKPLENWIVHRHGAQTKAVTLRQRRLYILPTAHGFSFALLLLILLLWAINYQNSLGFLLTFFIGAVALNAMWLCHRNLLHLRLHPGRAEAVFAGQTAQFAFTLDNPDPEPHYGVALAWNGQRGSSTELRYADIPAHGSAEVVLPLRAERRGRLRPPRLQISTRFPLGMFKAWAWVNFDQPCLVYPRPQGARTLPVTPAKTDGAQQTLEAHSGSEDYAGLRAYVPGDSPRHIAWKASAHGERFWVKRFADQSVPECWLDWYALEGLDTEARLSQLCRWVLDANNRGGDYGLRLPDQIIAPAHSSAHYRRCLQALALFPGETVDDGRGG